MLLCSRFSLLSPLFSSFTNGANMTTRLERKLANIRAGQYQPGDFIIADAKDGDIGFGRAAPGLDRSTGLMKSRETHLQAIREMTASGLVDVMLMSASTGQRLSKEGIFAGTD